MSKKKLLAQKAPHAEVEPEADLIAGTASALLFVIVKAIKNIFAKKSSRLKRDSKEKE